MAAPSNFIYQPPAFPSAVINSSAISVLYEFAHKAGYSPPVWEFTRESVWTHVKLKIAGKQFQACQFKKKTDAKRDVSAAAVKYFTENGTHEYFRNRAPDSHVSLLQKLCQALKEYLPKYELVDWNERPTTYGLGPFGAKCTACGHVFEAQGKYVRKQDAKEEAARIAYEYLSTPENKRLMKDSVKVTETHIGPRQKPRKKYRDYLAEFLVDNKSFGKAYYSTRLTRTGKFYAQVVIGGRPYAAPDEHPTKQEALEAAAKVAYDMLVLPYGKAPSDTITSQPTSSIAASADLSGASTSGVFGDDPSPGAGNRFISNGKRRRLNDDIISDGGESPDSSGAVTVEPVQTYYDLLREFINKRDANPQSQPRFSIVASETCQGVKCAVEIDGRRWITCRFHTKIETAKEDVCGDAYKDLYREEKEREEREKQERFERMMAGAG
ncbi:hypothetical protein HK104_001094 [Borealophlyctis nickersoniae]|nr:hypothetical protein HK104_001094 [Borealophlyctis nickersoniae]